MNVKVISKVENSQIKKNIPNFKIGDTLRLGLKVSDKKSEEIIQYFQGLLIRQSGSGLRKTITVRKIGANGVGVERIVPLHAKVLDSITKVSEGKARRARLYYLRKRVGKSALIP